MDGSNFMKCGCKGIRTCLLCETDPRSLPKTEPTNEEEVVYTYCPHCNLCWQDKAASKTSLSLPLYLGNIKVILDFLSSEEEATAIKEIDQIPWMPSQSGRKKQDFGPKVNFKKKKSKVGNFKGFPNFSKRFIDRFQQLKELSDFSPVELCHLDYSPDRGSAIEPHIDDFWIWGERLVTINLASQTILSLTPANAHNCDCLSFCTSEFPSSFTEECNHQTSGILSKTTDLGRLSSSCNQNFDLESVQCICAVYRTIESNVTPRVHVLLPPRSLIVLAGCARYNWFHAIKRDDIASRRLAMTFRELSSDFLVNENEKELGKELIDIGKRFCDFNVHS